MPAYSSFVRALGGLRAMPHPYRDLQNAVGVVPSCRQEHSNDYIKAHME